LVFRGDSGVTVFHEARMGLTYGICKPLILEG
jgi:hypothetical protein